MIRSLVEELLRTTLTGGVDADPSERQRVASCSDAEKAGNPCEPR